MIFRIAKVPDMGCTGGEETQKEAATAETVALDVTCKQALSNPIHTHLFKFTTLDASKRCMMKSTQAMI